MTADRFANGAPLASAVSADQLALIELPPLLTDRQQKALDAITGSGFDGLTSDELGAVLHHPKHSLEDRCAWCGKSGLEVGRALRAKNLVQQRRRRAPGGDLYMVWTVVGELKQPSEAAPFGDIPYRAVAA